MCHVTCGNAELRKVGSHAARGAQPASPAAPVLHTKLCPIRTRNEPSEKCDKMLRPSVPNKKSVRGPTDTVRLSSSAEGSGGAAADEDAARGPDCFRGEKRKASFLKNSQVETYSFASFGREHVGEQHICRPRYLAARAAPVDFDGDCRRARATFGLKKRLSY